MTTTIHFYPITDPYGFLSNFYAAPIHLDGLVWPTTEHYFQAQKFIDPAQQEMIRSAATPGAAKKRAWAPGLQRRADWDTVREAVMLNALRAKFSQHPDLRVRLLATGETVLAEHTANDYYWGDGGDGSGQNRLGALLMQVRHELRDQTGSSANRLIFDWLVDDNQIDLRRSPFLSTAPSAHVRPVTWDRVEGMLLGSAIGDALGNRTESQIPAHRRSRYGELRDYLANRYADNAPVGLPSDDSQLTFWTLEQINADHEVVPEHLARRFSRQRIFGIGSTVRAFLTSFKDRGLPWYASGPHSAGNGALMRVAPLLIPHLNAPSPDLWTDTALAAMITHNDAASTAACVAFVAILWELLGRTYTPSPDWWPTRYAEIAAGLEGSAAYAPRAGNFMDYNGPMSQYVVQRVREAEVRNLTVFDACETWYSGAYLMETLPCVLYILMRHADDFETSVVRAVNDTRDNDTVAAIVGAALGALHGAAAIPARWRNGLLGRLGADDDGRLFDLLEETRRLWFTHGPAS